MSNPTPAQEEFNELVAKNSAYSSLSHAHPEDQRDADSDQSDNSEEAVHRENQINAAMRMPTASAQLNLPPISFDSGRSTGVKGVIADARSYEMAKKSKLTARVQDARRGSLRPDALSASNKATLARGEQSDSEADDASSIGDSDDEGVFLTQWRETRRRELEREAAGAVRTRRTSPSMRMFGRLDEVDAMGYLDAIEKVGRETTVVVFVYDHECDVSAAVEAAMRPLVKEYPQVRFVKIHYEEIEFDNAAVPSILAYRNQGDLIANLTGIIEMIPDEEEFGSDAFKHLLHQYRVL